MDLYSSSVLFRQPLVSGKISPWAWVQHSASVRTLVQRAPTHTPESLPGFAMIGACTANQLSTAFESGGHRFYPAFHISFCSFVELLLKEHQQRAPLCFCTAIGLTNF
jgi:hypothetical protein